MRQQEEIGRKRTALITDIDNTFYRAGHEAAVKAAWDVRQKAMDAPYPIIAVTGADYEALVRGRLESNELPTVEIVVSSVGTEIWFLQPDGSYQKDDDYEKLLQAAGYKRLSITIRTRDLLPKLRKAGYEIDFQEPTVEAAYIKNPDPTHLPYKVSLHFFADEKKWSDIAKLFEQEFKRSKIVVCEEIHHNATLPPGERHKKYCLDIMAATKADAVNYLIEKLRLEQGVVAGDSGNDIDMLLKTPDTFVAVAVGGHKPELKAALEAHIGSTKTHKPIFIDTNDSRMAAQTLLLLDDFLSGNEPSSTILLNNLQ